MKAMTLKEFDSLSKRDFDNGAVIDAIRATLTAHEKACEGCETKRVVRELLKYAWHRPWCKLVKDYDRYCTCGYDKALKNATAVGL